LRRLLYLDLLCRYSFALTFQLATLPCPVPTVEPVFIHTQDLIKPT